MVNKKILFRKKSVQLKNQCYIIKATCTHFCNMYYLKPILQFLDIDDDNNDQMDTYPPLGEQSLRLHCFH